MLKVSGFKVGLVAAQAIAAGLSTPTTAVTELDLGGCSMYDSPVLGLGLRVD